MLLKAIWKCSPCWGTQMSMDTSAFRRIHQGINDWACCTTWMTRIFTTTRNYRIPFISSSQSVAFSWSCRYTDISVQQQTHRRKKRHQGRCNPGGGDTHIIIHEHMWTQQTCCEMMNMEREHRHEQKLEIHNLLTPQRAVNLHKINKGAHAFSGKLVTYKRMNKIKQYNVYTATKHCPIGQPSVERLILER